MAEEDDSSDEDEEAPAEGDENNSEGDADGAKRDDSSSESDDGEPSDKHLKRNRIDREKRAAARQIINNNDLGVVSAFAPGPRSLVHVLSVGPPSVGDIADTKNAAELRTLEAYEAASALPFMAKNESNILLMLCKYCSGKKQKKRRPGKSLPGDKDPSVTCLRFRWKACAQGKFQCTVANKRECDGRPGRDKSKLDPASCAFRPKHLAPVLLTTIKNGRIKPADAIEKLKEYTARILKYSFVKRAVQAARVLAGIDSISKGDDTDSVAMVSCLVAALNEIGGWSASYETCDAKEMRTEILEMAKSAHERDENEKKKECMKNKEPFVATRFDPSVIPDLDSTQKYLKSYTLAPDGTAPSLWECSPDLVTAGDFAHCTLNGRPAGSLGTVVGHDSNGHLIEICYRREYGNETLAAWRHLLTKAVEAVPAIDSDETILLMDDFKGGRGVLDVF